MNHLAPFYEHSLHASDANRNVTGRPQVSDRPKQPTFFTQVILYTHCDDTRGAPAGLQTGRFFPLAIQIRRYFP